MNYEKLKQLYQYRVSTRDHMLKMQALLGKNASDYALVETMVLSYEVQKELCYYIINAFFHFHFTEDERSGGTLSELAKLIACIFHCPTTQIEEKRRLLVDGLQNHSQFNRDLDQKFIDLLHEVDAELIGFQAHLASDGCVYVNEQSIKEMNEIVLSVEGCNRVYHENNVDREVVLAITKEKSIFFISRAKTRQKPPYTPVKLHALDQNILSRKFIVDLDAGSGIYGASVVPENDKIAGVLVQTEDLDNEIAKSLWSQSQKLDLSSVAIYGESCAVLLLSKAISILPYVFGENLIERLLINDADRILTDLDLSDLARDMLKVMMPSGEVELQWQFHPCRKHIDTLVENLRMYGSPMGYSIDVFMREPMASAVSTHSILSGQREQKFTPLFRMSIVFK